MSIRGTWRAPRAAAMERRTVEIANSRTALARTRAMPVYGRIPRIAPTRNEPRTMRPRARELIPRRSQTRKKYWKERVMKEKASQAPLWRAIRARLVAGVRATPMAAAPTTLGMAKAAKLQGPKSRMRRAGRKRPMHQVHELARKQ